MELSQQRVLLINLVIFVLDCWLNPLGIENWGGAWQKGSADNEVKDSLVGRKENSCGNWNQEATKVLIKAEVNSQMDKHGGVPTVRPSENKK